MTLGARLCTAAFASLTIFATIPAAPAGAAITGAAVECRITPSAGARAVARMAAGTPVQLLAVRGDWTMVRAENASPCWAASSAIVQGVSDVRAVTRYGAIEAAAGRVTLAPAAKAGGGADCPCSSGRTCRGPAGNRYCISRGILTTRGE